MDQVRANRLMSQLMLVGWTSGYSKALYESGWGTSRGSSRTWDVGNSTRGGNVRMARPGVGADAGQGIVGPIRSLAREFTWWRIV